jgi:hypothetical protein
MEKYDYKGFRDELEKEFFSCYFKKNYFKKKVLEIKEPIEKCEFISEVDKKYLSVLEVSDNRFNVFYNKAKNLLNDEIFFL